MDCLVAPDRLEIHQKDQVNGSHRSGNEGVRLQGFAIAGDAGVRHGLLFGSAFVGCDFLSVGEFGAVEGARFGEEKEFAGFLGLVLLKRGGQVVGAVGVTGDTSDNDEAVALAGIAAVGLEGVV